MNGKKRTIEDFLEPAAAYRFSWGKFRLLRIAIECFQSSHSLSQTYTDDMLAIEAFRADLSACLASNDQDAKSISERWAFFLRSRATMMESWSTFFAALMTLLGLSSALLALLFTNKIGASTTWMAIAFPLIAIASLVVKAHVDDRVAWYKFVSCHLEAIARMGAHPVRST